MSVPTGKSNSAARRRRERLFLGDRRLEGVELAPKASGLGPSFPQRALGAVASHVEERPDPGGDHADSGGGEPEQGLVGDDRDDADDHGHHGQDRAQRDAPIVGVPVGGGGLHDGTATSSASSATMSLRRKSFGV